jgi:hypothetical protein
MGFDGSVDIVTGFWWGDPNTVPRREKISFFPDYVALSPQTNDTD